MLPWVPTTLFATLDTADQPQFDDLPTIPGEGLLSPVGIYKGINFENFDVASEGVLNESTAGLIAHSNPNVAIFLANSTTKYLLTTLYPGSKTKSFSLSSFYYGCDAVLDQGAVSVAVACTITVTGYRAGSSAPYTTQTFDFTPAEPVDLMNPLTFGKFSTKFQNLVNATFTAEPTSLLDAGVSIDDLVGSTVS